MLAPLATVVLLFGFQHDALGLGDPTPDDETLIGAMLAHPIPINRPIVVTERGARPCRLSETVLEPIEDELDSFFAAQLRSAKDM